MARTAETGTAKGADDVFPILPRMACTPDYKRFLLLPTPGPGVPYGCERPPMPPTTTGLLAVEVEHENTMLKLDLTTITLQRTCVRSFASPGGRK